MEILIVELALVSTCFLRAHQEPIIRSHSPSVFLPLNGRPNFTRTQTKMLKESFVYIFFNSVFKLGDGRENIFFLLGYSSSHEFYVPKRRHIKFRGRGITQKKEYNIHNTTKVWNHAEKLSWTGRYQSHLQCDVFLIFPQTWLRPFTATRCMYITISSQLPLMKHQ
jgi:hypothetical protein